MCGQGGPEDASEECFYLLTVSRFVLYNTLNILHKFKFKIGAFLDMCHTLNPTASAFVMHALKKITLK